MTQSVMMPDGWRALKIDGFMGHIGPLLKSTDETSRNPYGLQMREAHMNAIGFVHGGVVTGFLDQVLALEAWNAVGRQPTVTVQMDTRFVRSARAGDFLEARADIRHETRSMIFVDADVYCGEDLVACANAVMKIVKEPG